MHLSTFGLIGLNGSINKPEPSLTFSNYQTALANYSATLALRAKLKPKQGAKNQAPATTPLAELPSEDRAVEPTKKRTVQKTSRAPSNMFGQRGRR